MKKYFTFLCLLCCALAQAQLPVTDIATQTSLANLSAQITTLNGAISTLNGTQASNQANTLASKLLSKDNLRFIQQVEDYMWIADDYLKRGKEKQMIYNKEEDILKKLREVKKKSMQFGRFEGGDKFISSINKNISGVIKKVGVLVDGAQLILGSDRTRMSTEGRRNILKETLSELMAIENYLDKILLDGRIKAINYENEILYEKNQDDVRKSMEKFRKK